MTDFDPGARRSGFGPGRIILIVLAGLAVFGLALFFILRTALGPVTETGDAFMGALRDRNDAQAYAAAAPDLQRSLGNADRLRAVVGLYRPARWSWSSRSVRNGFGRLSGSVTYQAGNDGTAELRLVQVDGAWRVAAFQFN